MCRFNSVVVNNGTAVAYSSMSTSTRPHPPVGVSGAVEIATRRERSSPGSVGLARSSPTNKNPAYAAYLPCPPHGWRKIVTGNPPPGPIKTPQSEHCPAGPGAFRTTNIDVKIKTGARDSATRISSKRNILPSGKDGSRLSEGPAPSPPSFLGSAPRGASST